MKKIQLLKKKDICQELNIDFNEATELFSDETLKSMQMMTVDGGVVFLAPWLIKGLFVFGGMVVGAAAAYYTEKALDSIHGGPSQSPGGGEGTITIENIGTFPASMVGDSIKWNVNGQECYITISPSR